MQGPYRSGLDLATSHEPFIPLEATVLVQGRGLDPRCSVFFFGVVCVFFGVCVCVCVSGFVLLWGEFLDCFWGFLAYMPYPKFPEELITR